MGNIINLLFLSLYLLLFTFISAKASYHEILSNTLSETPLPFPVSDLTATYTLAPDDDGNLIYAIYLLGGCISPYIAKRSSPNEYICPAVSNSNLVFDPNAGLFERRRDMPRKRYRHTSKAVGGMIWVVGGRDGDDNLVEEVDVYDPIHDTWTTLGKLPPEYAVSDHASFVLQDFLFIAGGYDNQYLASSSTFLIDTIASLNENILKIKKIASLNEARADAKSVTYGGRYGYIVGGFTHLNGFCDPLKSMEIYDLNQNRWKTVPAGALNVGRADVALFEYKGRFFALEGETRSLQKNDCAATMTNVTTKPLLGRSNTYPLNSVEVYDPADGLEGQWTIIHGGVPSNGHLMRFVVAPWPSTESIYAFGGIKYAPNDDNNSCQSGEGDCIELSSDMVIYMDAVEPDLLPRALLIGSGFVLAGISIFLFASRCKRARESEDCRKAEAHNSAEGGGDIALVGLAEEGEEEERWL